jgi:lipopolysaccharide/colanic/teichoic acid biosynthesis glycosyltransferase
MALPSATLPPERPSLAEPSSLLPGWKRALDLVICIAALPALGLVTLAVAVIRTLFSPGPVLYRQERVGRGGRRFFCIKFRTMRVCAPTSSHEDHFRALVKGGTPMQKLDARGDARLNAWTRMFRASGCDELPQLINVLRGDMSLVGPRPCLPSEFEHFTPSQRRRCDVAPGLTGLWQVSGKNRTTFERMIELDLLYIDSRSLGGDLKILARTVPAVAAELGAYLRGLKRPFRFGFASSPQGRPLRSGRRAASWWRRGLRRLR